MRKPCTHGISRQGARTSRIQCADVYVECFISTSHQLKSTDIIACIMVPPSFQVTSFATDPILQRTSVWRILMVCRQIQKIILICFIETAMDLWILVASFSPKLHPQLLLICQWYQTILWFPREPTWYFSFESWQPLRCSNSIANLRANVVILASLWFRQLQPLP